MATIVLPSQSGYEVAIADGETTPTNATIQREKAEELTKERVTETTGETADKDEANEDASSILVELDDDETSDDPEEGMDDWTPDDPDRFRIMYEYNHGWGGDYDQSEEPGDDFTACSAEECGWCGRCMY